MTLPKLPPGALVTGCVIVALLAVLAQASALGAGIVWDDVELIARDERIRDLSFLWECFGDAYFAYTRTNEMYRPVVSASFTVDWFVSGSSPGDVAVGWFHLVNLVLHAANAALAYVFLAELTGRKLGAPLLGAALFAIHPLAVEPVSWIVGRCDLLAAFFGFSAGIVFMRSPRSPRLVALAAALFGLSLFAKASFAMLPLLMAFSLVAYRDVPLGRFVGRRLLLRFGAFVVPAAIWIAARIAVLGAPFPVAGGKRWHHVGFVDGLLGMGRGLCIYVGNLVMPARLCGDYAADLAVTPGMGGLGVEAYVGVALGSTALVAGGAMLKRARWAFPVLAFTVALIPVLQVVPIGAIVAERFLYFPMLFAFLLVGEGLEYLFTRIGTGAAVPLLFVFVLLFGLQSHRRACIWRDDVTFNRDVLLSYPDARSARQRLAVALADRGGPGDRDEAKRLLRDGIARLQRPGEECKSLGAMEIEDGNLDEAEALLERALNLSAAPLLDAQVRYNLAVIARRRGNDEYAKRLLEDALESVPELREARDLLEKMRGRGDVFD